MRIAIFDDERERRESWKQKLERLNLGTIFSFEGDFKESVDSLERRRKEARRSTAESLRLIDTEDSKFDNFDILFIDYDLLSAIDLTGEEIGYLLRCYSRCGLVIVLNQFGDNRFDLTMDGHLESFVDLNLGETFLADHGLWGHEKWSDYRPWQWPVLPDSFKKFEQRVLDCEQWLERSLLDALGLDSLSLPRKTLEFIQCHGKAIEETTLEDFVLFSGNGLKRRDRPIGDLVPRIAAARIYKWLEALVLGGQEVLVDAPHLVSRFPSLLRGPLEDQESWNQTADLLGIHGVQSEIIQEFLFPRKAWTSKPAWFWSGVRSCTEINEVADPWSVKAHDWAFCEDASSFVERSKAREFVADLPTSSPRRFVRKFEHIEYHPAVRFSL